MARTQSSATTERHWTEIFETCGEPAETTRTILIAVDKLDKMPWSMVRRELVEEKGLKAHVAGRIEGVCDAERRETDSRRVE
jgi:hypothetical protein